MNNMADHNEFMLQITNGVYVSLWGKFWDEVMKLLRTAVGSTLGSLVHLGVVIDLTWLRQNHCSLHVSHSSGFESGMCVRSVFAKLQCVMLKTHSNTCDAAL